MNHHMFVQIKRLAVFVAMAMVLICNAQAANTIDSVRTADGKLYQNVRWGPVNGGKVVMFHNRGVTIIPLADLPEEYQAQFGYTPPAEPTPTVTPRKRTTNEPAPPRPDPASQPSPVVITPPSTPTPNAAEMREQFERMRSHDNNSPESKHWKQYNEERVSKLLFQGKLVEKAILTPIIGYVVTGQYRAQDGDRSRQATVIELAVKRSDTKDVAEAMSLRPALWRSTGEQLLLLDYRPDGEMAGTLIRVYGKETASLDDKRSFIIGTEPSFKEWLKLRNL